MLDATNVLVGTPDQAAGTGAILSAPLGTTLPTSVDDATTGFVDSGYISEDGLQLANDLSTTDIMDWSGSLVRRIKESFSGTLTWNQLETNAEALKNAFGDDAVTVTAATQTHGEQLAVAIKGELPAAKSWIFKIKDGNAKILIVVPNGQVTSLGEVSFTAGDAIVWPVTLSAYPDSTGTSIYIYTDNGKATA